MGERARGSGDDPDDWEPVDDPASTFPEYTFPSWRQLCRLLLLRCWIRGQWHELGMYLQKLKNRGKGKGPLPACHCKYHLKGPDEPSPDSGAGGTTA